MGVAFALHAPWAWLAGRMSTNVHIVQESDERHAWLAPAEATQTARLAGCAAESQGKPRKAKVRPR